MDISNLTIPNQPINNSDYTINLKKQEIDKNIEEPIFNVLIRSQPFTKPITIRDLQIEIASLKQEARQSRLQPNLLLKIPLNQT